jgi:hypothetical protein
MSSKVNQKNINSHNICIAVTTYKRNDALLSLIVYIKYIINNYNSLNNYSICVSDSCHSNPEKNKIQQYANYFLNDGEGFDDNILTIYRRCAPIYDYILTISDDDHFNKSINPLYIIDAAISERNEAILFNHINFSQEYNNSNFTRYYDDLSLVNNNDKLLNEVITRLPRHIGLIYSTKLLKENNYAIELFKNTLHLYSSPFIFAAMRNKAIFFDYPLLVFNNCDKNDGAWENGGKVFIGLIIFLKNMKQFLSSNQYNYMKNGFFKLYFSENAWLRSVVSRFKSIPSEAEIHVILDDLPC